MQRGKADDNARSVAVIWDMHVFSNQLIGCENSFKRNFYMDRNFVHLFFYLAAWHQIGQITIHNRATRVVWRSDITWLNIRQGL